MNRGLLTLLLGLAVGVGSHWVYFAAHRTYDPSSLDSQLSWMKSELNLSDAQYARIRELHEASSPRLRSLAVQVAQMQSEFAAFENTRRNADRVDFVEFAKFVAVRREVDEECRDSTRRLVMAAAGEMNPDQRQRYLGLVAVTAPSASPLSN